MPSHETSSRDDINRWLADADDITPSMPKSGTDDARRRQLRRAAMIAALVLPWCIALVMLVASPPTHASKQRPGTAAGPADPPIDVAATTEPDPATGSTPTAAPGSGSSSNDVDDDARPIPATRTPEVDAVAVAMVRDAVTAVDGDDATALDLATAGTGTPVGADTWIVRVHAVVLRGDRQRWHTAAHEVWAAPVGMRAGRATALDRPWKLDDGGPPSRPPRWAPATVDVDPDALRAALTAAGYRPTATALERHPSVPDLVRAEVRGSDDGAGRVHVWVRTTPTVAVLGMVDDQATDDGRAPPAAANEAVTEDGNATNADDADDADDDA